MQTSKGNMTTMTVGTSMTAPAVSLGTLAMASSSSSLRQGALSFASGHRIVDLVSLTCVQKVHLTIQAKHREVEPVALAQSIQEAWMLLNGNGVSKNAAIVAMNVLLTMPVLAEEKGKIKV